MNQTTHTHRCLSDTRVGGKPVHKGQEVSPSAEELAAAPWAFESLISAEEAAAEEQAHRPGPSLFEQLRTMDREAGGLDERNRDAVRKRRADVALAQALSLLGVRSKANPVDIADKVAELMGYEERSNGADKYHWVLENVERWHRHYAGMTERAKELDDQVHELQRQMVMLKKQAEEAASLQEKLDYALKQIHALEGKKGKKDKAEGEAS